MWILIALIFTTHNGGGIGVLNQEFNTREKCENARQAIFILQDDKLVKAVCLEK